MKKAKLLFGENEPREEIKTRIPVWLYPSTLEVIDRAAETVNCKSRSEYLERAALFYAGYISGQDAKKCTEHPSEYRDKYNPVRIKRTQLPTLTDCDTEDLIGYTISNEKPVDQWCFRINLLRKCARHQTVS